jgi:hypothetical protein
LVEATEVEVRWPQEGDSLFASGIQWEKDALLVAPWDWFLSYALSYKEAAAASVRAVEDGTVSPDIIVFATVFLYRHYIELMLKGLIKIGRQLRDRTSAYPNDEHKILLLWQECKPLLEFACPDGNQADTTTVENLICEFAKFDPLGLASRYGEHQDGKPTIKDRRQFSLTNMREVMNGLSGFLEGSYDCMHDLLQHQADADVDSL